MSCASSHECCGWPNAGSDEIPAADAAFRATTAPSLVYVRPHDLDVTRQRQRPPERGRRTSRKLVQARRALVRLEPRRSCDGTSPARAAHPRAGRLELDLGRRGGSVYVTPKDLKVFRKPEPKPHSCRIPSSDMHFDSILIDPGERGASAPCWFDSNAGGTNRGLTPPVRRDRPGAS